MDINVRETSMYANVDIEEGNTKIDLGMLNRAERVELAAELLDAASDLLHIGFDYDEQRTILNDMISEL